MQTDSTVTMTAACEALGRHAGTGRAACKGVVLSLTDAHGSPCACDCHGKKAGQGIAAGLPETFAELVFLTPPCDQDVVLDEDEIEALAEIEADRLLEDEWIGAWS